MKRYSCISIVTNIEITTTRNAKYPDLSSPILQVVPSILPFDHTGHMTIRSHDHSTTIAAIFDYGKKLLSV